LRYRDSAFAMSTTMEDVELDTVTLVRLHSPAIGPPSSSNFSQFATFPSYSPTVFGERPEIGDPLPSIEKNSLPTTSERLESGTMLTPKSSQTGESPPNQITQIENVSSGPYPSYIMDTPRGQLNNCMFCLNYLPPGGDIDARWIQCNGCKGWVHILCTDLSPSIDTATIDKFHCQKCESARGPTTCISLLHVYN
jgi:hypothetical protein